LRRSTEAAKDGTTDQQKNDEFSVRTLNLFARDETAGESPSGDNNNRSLQSPDAGRMLRRIGSASASNSGEIPSQEALAVKSELLEEVTRLRKRVKELEEVATTVESLRGALHEVRDKLIRRE